MLYCWRHLRLGFFMIIVMAPSATPEQIREEEGEEKVSTKKKKALEIQKVKEGVKAFSAIDPTSMPQGPEGGITPPT